MFWVISEKLYNKRPLRFIETNVAQRSFGLVRKGGGTGEFAVDYIGSKAFAYPAKCTIGYSGKRRQGKNRLIQ
jgi:hypothetical protein